MWYFNLTGYYYILQRYTKKKKYYSRLIISHTLISIVQNQIITFTFFPYVIQPLRFN